MPLEEVVLRHSVFVAHNDFVGFQREIELSLESGGTATLVFPNDPPDDWLQFEGSHTTVFMAQDEFADVYHVLQTESPVFFTALNLFGIRVGSVHTKIDPGGGQAPPHGVERPPRNLTELIQRARREKAASPAKT
jgi:hypothetical protein